MVKKTKGKYILLVLFESMFIFGLVIFSYEAGVSYFQPQWLDKQVVHFQEPGYFLKWCKIRNDEFGMLALIASIIGFFGMKLCGWKMKSTALTKCFLADPS